MNHQIQDFLHKVARSACLEQRTGEAFGTAYVTGDKCICFSCEASRLLANSLAMETTSQTCPKCKGTGLDEKHRWPNGSAASCEDCEGYGTLQKQYGHTQEEKEAAQIIDQLCPVFIACTGAYIGPETFKRLTIRLTELLAKHCV